MQNLIYKLKNMSTVMRQIGDLEKAQVCDDAIVALEQKAISSNEFDIELAESMFSKRELAELYVKKLKEVERLKVQIRIPCSWCGELKRIE